MYLKWLLSLNHNSLRKSILCPVLVGKLNNNQSSPALTILLEARPKQPNRHTVRNMSPVSIYLLIVVLKEGLPSFLFLEVEYGSSHNELTIFQSLCRTPGLVVPAATATGTEYQTKSHANYSKNGEKNLFHMSYIIKR